MKLWIVLLLGAASFVNAAKADQLCGRSFDSLPQLDSDLQAKGYLTIKYPHYIAIMEGETIWFFADETRPASPAVVCRRSTQIANQTEVTVQVRCGGGQAACNELIAKVVNSDMSGLFRK
jgi:hypothetical protein